MKTPLLCRALPRGVVVLLSGLVVLTLGESIAAATPMPPAGEGMVSRPGLAPRAQEVLESPRGPGPTDRLDRLRVLWVGAHPDDEALAAAWLGWLCRERGARCTFVVTTGGESGPCLREEGCEPDLATVRAGEMARAAALYSAELIHLRWPDVSGPDPEAVLAAWAMASGGADRLRDELASVIRQVDPLLILTFDPRHGSTCHPAHRALGRLVIEVVTGAADLWSFNFVLADRIELVPDLGLEAEPVAGDAALIPLHPDRPAPALGGTLWDYLVETMRIHRSQFDAGHLAAVDRSRIDADRFHLLPAGARLLGEDGAGPCAP